MKTEKMFELAVRSKMRFPFKGVISVEDLWDLSAENLNSIFKQLNAQAKQANEESLLEKRTEEDEILDTKIEIVRYIVGVKVAEEAARKSAVAKRLKDQKILAIISDKQDADLQGKSIEELMAMLDGSED